MSSSVVFALFDGYTDAWNADSAIRMMPAFQPPALQYAATMSRNSTGKVEISLRGYLPLNLKDTNLFVLFQLVNACFGGRRDVASRLVEVGLDKHWVEQLGEVLLPGYSAFIVYTPPERMTDLDRLQTILSILKGRLYSATFPEEVGRAVVALG